MISQSGRPTVIEVVTPWCGACRAMGSDLVATAAAYEGRVDLVVVDATEEPGVAEQLGIAGTPTLIGGRDGVEVFRVVGRRSATELEDLFEGLAAGAEVPVRVVGKVDRTLRVATGGVLVAIGLVSAPAWPLVAVGVGVVFAGLWRGMVIPA